MKRLSVLLSLTLYFLLNTSTSLAAPVGWTDPTAAKPATFCDLEFVFVQAIGLIVAIVGLASFLSLISGGFKLIASGGDAKAVEAAHKTLSHAILGLVLLISSIFILRFIQYFTGVDVLTFKINSSCR